MSTLLGVGAPKDIYNRYIWDGFILFIPKYTETKIIPGPLVPYLLPAIVAVAAVVGVLVATAGPGHRSEWEDLAGHLYQMVYILGSKIYTK